MEVSENINLQSFENIHSIIKFNGLSKDDIINAILHMAWDLSPNHLGGFSIALDGNHVNLPMPKGSPLISLINKELSYRSKIKDDSFILILNSFEVDELLKIIHDLNLYNELLFWLWYDHWMEIQKLSRCDLPHCDGITKIASHLQECLQCRKKFIGEYCNYRYFFDIDFSIDSIIDKYGTAVYFCNADKNKK